MKSLITRISICFFLLLTSQLSYGQLKDWAAGFRIGEPGGFMARKYSENGINAIEVNIGTYGGLWGTDRTYQDGTTWHDVRATRHERREGNEPRASSVLPKRGQTQVSQSYCQQG